MINELKRGPGRPPGQFKYSFPCRVNGKNTKLYTAWQGMKQRCLNPRSHIWKYYGGRGITICAQWLSFENFACDMGEPPTGTTLDRIDNDGSYSPENCRWATRKEQAANRRKGGPFDSNSLRQKALAAGLSYSVVYQRVRLHGWPLEKALTTPKFASGKHPREAHHRRTGP